MSSLYLPPPPPLPPRLEEGGGATEHHVPFENLKPSILIIILILSITVLVSLSLCLLLRLLNRRCIGHLSPTSSNITTTSSSTNGNQNAAASHRVSPEIPDLSILDSLPLFPFASIKRRSSSAASGDCAVCLSKFESQDLLRLLPLCCHAFHAQCIDTWLVSNQTCPLCRSPVTCSESDILKSISVDDDGAGIRSSGSFRLEIGSISRRQSAPLTDSATPTESRGSYSVGSFDYVVEEETEITVNGTHSRNVSDKETAPPAHQEESLAADVASGRSWLRDYVDRLSMSISSSRAFSGRFFGSCRRSGDYDPEAFRAGEEISEIFSWLSEV